MRLRVQGNIYFKRRGDARKAIRRYYFYMEAVGYGVKEEWHDDVDVGDLLWNAGDFGDPRSLLQLDYRKDGVTKVRGQEIGTAVQNIMASCCKHMDCQTERIYMNIERIMDVRIDCCIAAG